MKKILLTKLILVASLFATDYTSMTTDELNALKGSVSAEDKSAFQSEMKSRMQSLTPEERANYTKTGSSTSQRTQDGTGSGSMYKGSMGHGGKR